MRDFPELRVDGGAELSVIMAVQVRPDGGVRVEIFASMNVFEHRSFASHDYNRIGLKPVTHLRERMPNVLMVEFGERMHGKSLN